MLPTTALLSLLPFVSLAFTQDAGKFNVLTFNVAGLPPILNGNDVPGDKTDNTARIGQLFTQYNISLIHVQEDFNFHATLYANDNHPYRTPTSGGVPFGSGLNTMSNYPYTSFQRIKWGTCSNIDSADCLTPKGFTFMRVQLAPGVSVDAYNLHADAGTTAADLVARAANLRQVSDYITANSIGNPVVVFGDSNSRYTRAPDDIPGIFGQQNGMKDVWIELVRNGVPPPPPDAITCDNPSKVITCEIVDKVWYRGSAAVSLQASSFAYAGDMFQSTDGHILSDHNGVLVDFGWTRNANLRVSDTFGGDDGGNWYNDLSTVSSVSSPRVATITVQGQNRVDAVSMTLASGQTVTHGGTGGSPSTLTLNSGERLVGATICRGAPSGKSTRVFYLQMKTSAGRTVQNGVKTSDCVDMNAPSGFAITGFLGRSADELDTVGFVYSKV